MSVSVTSSPSGIQPVGTGKMLYVFHESSMSGKVNYRIRIQLNGLGLPDFDFYPDLNDDITCDIAPALRHVLDMSPTVANRFKNTYVKYQAIWEAASNSQISLSSNVIYFYIGSNNYLNYRAKTYIDASGGKFLNFDKVFAWAGRTTYIDFLYNGLASDTELVLSQYNLANENFTSTLFPWYNDSSTHGTLFLAGSLSWTLISDQASSNKTALSRSKTLMQDISLPAGSYIVEISFTLSSGTPTATANIGFGLYDDSGNYYWFLNGSGSAGENPGGATQPNYALGTYSIQIPISTVRTYTHIGVQFGGGSSALLITIDRISIGVSSNITTFDASGIGLKSIPVIFTIGGTLLLRKASSPYTLYASVLLDYREECRNPIYIKWLNNYGGLSVWMFEYNQIVTDNPQDFGKYRIKRGESVVKVIEYEMLEELNKDGAEYGDNLKLGAYLVDFTVESSPINIYALPEDQDRLSRRVRDYFSIALRYPLIDNILI